MKVNIISSQLGRQRALEGTTRHNMTEDIHHGQTQSECKLQTEEMIQSAYEYCIYCYEKKNLNGRQEVKMSKLSNVERN